MFFYRRNRNNNFGYTVLNVKYGAKNTNIASKEKRFYGNDMQ
ncbi:hypothetical protein [Filifactor alocis]